MASLLRASLIICLFFGWGVSANYFAHVQRLKHDLLQGYDKDVIPNEHFDGNITVAMELSAQSFHVNERAHTFKFNAYVAQEWTDFRLQWSPEEYDHIEEIHLPDHLLWRPDIVLYKQKTYVRVNYSNDLTQRTPVLAVVQANGSVVHVSPHHFHVPCPSTKEDLKSGFKSCLLKMGSWAYGDDKVLVAPRRNRNWIEFSAANVDRERTDGKWLFFSGTVNVNKSTFDVFSQPRMSLEAEIKLKRTGMNYN